MITFNYSIPNAIDNYNKNNSDFDNKNYRNNKNRENKNNNNNDINNYYINSNNDINNYYIINCIQYFIDNIF